MKVSTIPDIDRMARDGEKNLKSERAQLIFGLGTCGIASGGKKLMEFAIEYLDERGVQADLISVGCIGMCHAEPLVDVKIPGKPRLTYQNMDVDMLRSVIDMHLIGGIPVKEYALAQLASELSVCEYGTINYPERYEGIPTYEDLPFFSKQIRVVLRNCGVVDPENIDEYIARGGYRSAFRVLGEMTPDEVIEEMKISGLRGRGGAGFPTGLKWQFARTSKAVPKYIICNADEGDPGAYMDRAVLEGDPHSVLEGMLITAYAIGSSEGYIYIRAEYPLAIGRLHRAIREAKKRGLLGKNIMGSDFSFDIHIREGAGVFVCGEETALIRSIEGKRGEPRPRPPFPAAKGLWGKPTNINNVETLANIAMIIQKGGKWFSSMGTEKSKGTKVFSLVGKINRTGLVEVPMGIRMRDIIYDIGGGIQNGRKFKAVQTGGPSGGCIPPEHLDTEVDYENLKALGSIVGSGGMVVLDEDTCMVDVAKYFLSFTSEESCGQCTPCRVGTRRLLEILERITLGTGKESDLETLRQISIQVRDSSLCALGGTAPNPILTTLDYFRDEYEDHIRNRRCRASVCAALFSAPCENTCPAGTNVPGYIQLISEGRYGEAYELNREDNPFPAVCGRICEHPCEDRCRRAQFDEPLAIRELKRFCADRGLAGEGENRPEITRLEPTGKKIAIVGGGPSGLAAAYFLARLGHSAEIFEASGKLGGMLRYGIPQYRLPHEFLDREISDILELGVKAHYNCRIGRDIALSRLMEDQDAVYIAVGAQKDRTLGFPGEDLPGVLPGLRLLRDINSAGDVDIGKSIIVIGGGNVAVDVARSAIRMGSKATICYRREERDMPAYAEEIEEAKKEGIGFRFLVAPESILVEDGKAVGVLFWKNRMGDYTKWGRRTPVPTDETVEIHADNTVVAIGQMLDNEFAGGFREQLINGKNFVSVEDERLATSLGKVYAGGDAILGPASAIEAIAHGKKAAGSIDERLTGKDHLPDLKKMSKIRYSMEEPDNDEIMPRQHPAELSVDQRIRSFAEVVGGYDDECAKKEALRCFRCDLSAEEGDE